MKTLDNRPATTAFSVLKQLMAGALFILLTSQVAGAGPDGDKTESALVRCGLNSTSQEQSLDCYRKAADNDESDAQMALGWAYLRGDGVVRDPVEGYKWLFLAVGRNEETARLLKDIEWALTPEQVAQGRQAARKWEQERVAAASKEQRRART